MTCQVCARMRRPLPRKVRGWLERVERAHQQRREGPPETSKPAARPAREGK